MVQVVHSVADMARLRGQLPGTLAVVPTMGALHAGHRSLMRRAREVADHVVVTVFVNPLQFRPGEDFAEYPRTLDADVAVCGEEGVDVVFAPSEAELYPRAKTDMTRVIPGPLGEILEGASRPGFFTGVLTIVNKLFQVTGANAAVFGEKDYQQLALVRRMSEDFNMGVDVIGVATKRDEDGLASSSRNAYLSTSERSAGLAIPRAIAEAHASLDPLAAAEKILAEEPGLRVDYVALTSPDLSEAPSAGEARLLIAAFAGATRLIDNAKVTVVDSTATGSHEDSPTGVSTTSTVKVDSGSDPAYSARLTTHSGDRDA